MIGFASVARIIGPVKRSVVVCVLLASTSCVMRPAWWADHPDQFRVATGWQSAEIVPRSVKGVGESPKPFRFPLVMQNNSPEGFYFAIYDTDRHAWVKDGVTVLVTLADDPKVRLVGIDYSALSGVELRAGGDSGPAVWVTVQPDASLWEPGDKAVVKGKVDEAEDVVGRVVKPTIVVQWDVQDVHGRPVTPPLRRSARFDIELVCVDRVEPVFVSTPGH